MHSAGAEKPFSQVEFPKMVRCSDVLLVMIQTLRICGATLFFALFRFFLLYLSGFGNMAVESSSYSRFIC